MDLQVTCNNVSIQLGGKTILSKIDLHLSASENLAITGESGSGKSSLALALTKKLFYRGEIIFTNALGKPVSPKIMLLEQQHVFKNNSNISNFYYQQRFNSCDATDTRIVRDEISTEQTPESDLLINQLGLTKILCKPLIQLSNGESKRLQLAKAILQKPDLLILDNPFTGLDTAGRNLLREVLNELSSNGIKIILIAHPSEMPSCIDKILSLKDGHAVLLENKNFQIFREAGPKSNLFYQSSQTIKQLKEIFKEKKPEFHEVIRMENVNISYNGNTILENINWIVKQGEKWLVTGPNGSGKSTLLSLINADNPQAYANKIWLFDKKRGSGESIWDIKSNIGFVSPELHLYFEKGISVFDAVASGLYDTIGLFRKPSPADSKVISTWLSIINLALLSSKMLNQLSLGQQRLVMLARALVKAPALLILDEPCQGLDDEQTNGFKSLLEAICQVSDTTLIYVSHYTNDIPGTIEKKLNLISGKAVEILANNC